MRREERKEIMIGKETEEERKRKKRDWKRKYFRRCEYRQEKCRGKENVE